MAIAAATTAVDISRLASSDMRKAMVRFPPARRRPACKLNAAGFFVAKPCRAHPIGPQTGADLKRDMQEGYASLAARGIIGLWQGPIEGELFVRIIDLSRELYHRT